MTPDQLLDAARCFKCIPVGMQQEVTISIIGGGDIKPPEQPSFLIQDDGDYILLDDGGRIKIS